jgi:hypothetical protein
MFTWLEKPTAFPGLTLLILGKLQRIKKRGGSAGILARMSAKREPVI